MPPSGHDTDHKLTAATYLSPLSAHKKEPTDGHAWRKEGPIPA